MELDAPDPVAEIHQRSAGVLLHHTILFFGNRDGPHTLRNLDRLPMAGREIEVGASGSSSQILVIPALFPGGEQLFHVGRDWLSFFLHSPARGFHASRVPEFERTHSP